MTSRVRIGTCSGPADAALVRSVFEAHGIHVVIGAEHHAGMLGGLGGGFLSLDIIVAEADAEQAVALLQDIREGDHEASDDIADEPDPGPSDPERDEQADADGVWGTYPEKPIEDLPGAAAVAPASDHRRRTAVALFLGLVVSFGTAHMFTGAWLRGITLAGIEVLGITYLGTAPDLAVALMFGARIADAAGAVWRIRSAPRPGLPLARSPGA
jgi:hypothetical protein